MDKQTQTYIDNLVKNNEWLKAAVYSNHQQSEEYKGYLTEAILLLEALADTDPSGYGAESSTRYCPYCRASEDMDDVPVEHISDCSWLKIRAFLRKMMEPA